MTDGNVPAGYEELLALLGTRGKPHWANIGLPYGWMTLVSELDAAMVALDPDYELHQVKEKFAGLRFYYQPSGKAGVDAATQMMQLAQDAERASYKICTYCGEPGRGARRVSGWWDTVCDAHMQEGWARHGKDED